MTLLAKTHAVPHPAALSAWGDQEDVGELICCAVRDVTHDVKTFVFESVGGHVFHFDPGQFITLRLQIDGRDIRRSYTVSSPPTRPRRLTITVKRQPGGVVSNWLHDTLQPGQRITADPPLGVFTMMRHPSHKYLFLSGGSGITPLLSMTRTLVDLGAQSDITFVHSARTPSDIVERAELAALPHQSPSVKVVEICATDSDDEVWLGRRGFLDRQALEEIAPDLHEREVFVCGPGPYMAAVRSILGEVGFNMEHHHEETFVFEDLGAGEKTGPTGADTGKVQSSADEAAPADEVGTAFTVVMSTSGRTFPCGPEENILDAAFRAGLTPASSCSQGVCGTCKTLKLSGEVDMQHNGGIRPREITAGKILICCSKPLSDVTLEA